MARPEYTVHLTYHVGFNGSGVTCMKVLVHRADAKAGKLSNGSEVNLIGKPGKLKEAYGNYYFCAEAHYDHEPDDAEIKMAVSAFRQAIAEQVLEAAKIMVDDLEGGR